VYGTNTSSQISNFAHTLLQCERPAAENPHFKTFSQVSVAAFSKLYTYGTYQAAYTPSLLSDNIEHSVTDPRFVVLFWEGDGVL
jgi:hypothetical protein